MQGSEFVDEWRNRRLCALTFGMWKSSITRGYDVEYDISRMKAEKFYMNRRRSLFFNRIKQRLTLYAGSYKNMIYVKYFVILIAYRKGLHRWWKYMEYRRKGKSFARMYNDKVLNPNVLTSAYPMNNMKRIVSAWWSNRNKSAQAALLMNKAIEGCTRRKETDVINLLVENYNRCLFQSENDTRGRVYYLESLFARLVRRLKVGCFRTREAKNCAKISLFHRKQRKCKIALASLARMGCESVARKRVGQLLQKRYAKSALRRGLLRFILNYSYRMDLKIYNRTYVHNCMILHKKGVGMKLWKLYMRRRRKHHEHENIGSKHCKSMYMKRVFVSNWKNKCSKLADTGHHPTTSIHQHVVISNIRADCFCNKYKNGKYLSVWKHVFALRQREIISKCRSIIFWKLWRLKVTLCRRWMDFVSIRKMKRERIRHARFKHKSILIKNSCRAIIKHADYKVFRESVSNTSTSVMALVRKVGLHWLQITRKNRKLRSILFKCSAMNNGTDSVQRTSRPTYISHAHVLQAQCTESTCSESYCDAKQPNWASPTSVMHHEVTSSNDVGTRYGNVGTSQLYPFSHYGNAFQPPRSLPPPLTSIAMDLGSKCESNEGSHCSIRHGSSLLVSSHTYDSPGIDTNYTPESPAELYEKKKLVLEYISLLETCINSSTEKNTNITGDLVGSKEDMVEELSNLMKYVATLE